MVLEIKSLQNGSGFFFFFFLMENSLEDDTGNKKPAKWFRILIIIIYFFNWKTAWKMVQEIKVKKFKKLRKNCCWYRDSFKSFNPKFTNFLAFFQNSKTKFNRITNNNKMELN